MKHVKFDVVKTVHVFYEKTPLRVARLNENFHVMPR